MGAGIGVYFWLAGEPPRWLGARVLPRRRIARRSRAGGAAAARRPPASSSRWRWDSPRRNCRSALVAAPVLEHRLGPVEVDGRLVAVDPLPEGARLVVAPTHIDRLDAARLPARVRVGCGTTTPRLDPGRSGSACKAVLMPPPAPAMPGAYDFERRAWFDRLGAVGYALGAPRLDRRRRTGDGAGLARRADRGAAHAASPRASARRCPAPTGAIAAALIAGETHAIPPADAGAFRDAGLAHILVIAGLHMGMVAGIAFFARARAPRADPARGAALIRPRNARPPAAFAGDLRLYAAVGRHRVVAPRLRDDAG